MPRATALPGAFRAPIPHCNSTPARPRPQVMCSSSATCIAMPSTCSASAPPQPWPAPPALYLKLELPRSPHPSLAHSPALVPPHGTDPTHLHRSARHPRAAELFHQAPSRRPPPPRLSTAPNRRNCAHLHRHVLHPRPARQPLDLPQQVLSCVPSALPASVVVPVAVPPAAAAPAARAAPAPAAATCSLSSMAVTPMSSRSRSISCPSSFILPSRSSKLAAAHRGVGWVRCCVCVRVCARALWGAHWGPQAWRQLAADQRWVPMESKEGPQAEHLGLKRRKPSGKPCKRSTKQLERARRSPPGPGDQAHPPPGSARPTRCSPPPG